MVLHIGEGTYVLNAEIIAMLNYRASEETKNDFLEGKKVIDVGGEETKTAVITQKNGNDVIYLSPISIYTLRKRFLQGISAGVENRG